MAIHERRTFKEWLGDGVAAGSREFFVEILPPTFAQKSAALNLRDPESRRRHIAVQRVAGAVEVWALAHLPALGLSTAVYVPARLTSYLTERRAKRIIRRGG